MSEEDFKLLFSKRLRYYLNKYDMTQLELSKKLGVGNTSVYNWCNGIKTPRMDKVDAMCTIFNCRRSDLIEDKYKEEPTPQKQLKILQSYNKLNDSGKREAEKRVAELTYIPKYIEKSPKLKAAHERTDIEVTDEMKQHDEDIMNDENF